MKRILACAALSVILLSGCTTAKFNKMGAAVVVDGTPITKAEIEKAVDKQIDNSFLSNFGGAKNLAKTDENTIYLTYRLQVIKELTIKTLIENEIKKRNITVTQEDIDNELKTIIDKIGSKEELNTMLKSRKVSNDEFMKDLKTQIEIKKLTNSLEKINVSDADAKKYYDEHPSEFVHSEQVRASHILVSSDTLEMIKKFKSKNKNITPEELNKKLDQAKAANKAKAEAILKEVKANPDNFEKIAKDKSDDKSSGERGGELGFFGKQQMVPEFSKAAFSMKPNTISDSLVETSYGYHIIKVTDRIEAGTTPFVKVKDDIKYYLETQQQIEILRKLLDGLQKNAKIEYLDKNFNPEYLTSKMMENSKKTQEANKKKNKEQEK